MRNAFCSFMVAALTAILFSAQPQPAWASEDGNADYGGVHGWGGLYRENHDVGHFPEYVDCGPRYYWQQAAYHDERPQYCRHAPARHKIVARRHAVIHHNVAVHRHGIARHCAPKRPRPHRCICR